MSTLKPSLAEVFPASLVEQIRASSMNQYFGIKITNNHGVSFKLSDNTSEEQNWEYVNVDDNSYGLENAKVVENGEDTYILAKADKIRYAKGKMAVKIDGESGEMLLLDL